MATLTYHRKPNGTTYVYHQKSFWDKSKSRSATKQVCIGKLGDDGEVIYNKNFSDRKRQRMDVSEYSWSTPGKLWEFSRFRLEKSWSFLIVCVESLYVDIDDGVVNHLSCFGCSL